MQPMTGGIGVSGGGITGVGAGGRNTGVGVRGVGVGGSTGAGAGAGAGTGVGGNIGAGAGVGIGVGGSTGAGGGGGGGVGGNTGAGAGAGAGVGGRTCAKTWAGVTSPVANAITTPTNRVETIAKTPMVIGFFCAYVRTVFVIIVKYCPATRVAYKKGVIRRLISNRRILPRGDRLWSPPLAPRPIKLRYVLRNIRLRVVDGCYAVFVIEPPDTDSVRIVIDPLPRLFAILISGDKSFRVSRLLARILGMFAFPPDED